MAKDDECLEAIRVASGGDKRIDPETLLQRLKVARDINIGEKGLNPVDALAQAGEQVVAEHKLGIEQARYGRFVDLEKRSVRQARIYDNVQQLITDNPKMPLDKAMQIALSAQDVSTHRPMNGAYDNYGTNLKLMQKVGVDMPLSKMAGEGLMKYAFGKENYLNISKEFGALNSDGKLKPGYSGDKNAQRVAEIWHEAGASIMSALRNEGVFIKELPEYSGRTSYDPEKVDADSPQEFQRFVEQHVDQVKTFAGREVDDPAQFYKDIHANLATGNHLVAGHEEGFSDPTYKPSPGKASSLLQRRTLYWRDPESQYAVMQRYGKYENFGAQQVTAMDQMSKAYAAIKQYGRAPALAREHDIDTLLARFQEESPDNHAAIRQFTEDGTKQKLMNTFKLLDGTGNRPTYQAWANLTRGVQAAAVLKYGPAIPVIHYFAAPVTGAATYRHIGSNGFTGAINGLQNMLRIWDPSARQQAAEIASSFVEGIHGHLFSDFSFTDTAQKAGTFSQRLSDDFKPSWNPKEFWKDTSPSGMLSTLAGGFMKAVGLDRVAGLNRTFWEVPASKILADELKKPFDGLTAPHQSTLKGFNIQGDDWKLMQSIAPVLSSHGIEHLTPNLAYTVPDEDIHAMLESRGAINEKTGENMAAQMVGKYKDDLARRMWLYLQEGSRNMLNQPGTKVASLLQGSQEAHTTTDAAWRTARQLATFFKQWPTELIYNTYARNFFRSDTLASGTARTLATASGLAVAGYMTMAVTSLYKGEQPPDPTDIKTWAKAALRGGSGTILADLTGSEILRQGNFKERIGSMLGGVAVSQVEPAVKLLSDGLAGKDVDKDMQKLFKDQVGFTQAWYSALATNYLFLWHLYDTINPGWAEKEEADAEKYGHPYLSDSVRPTQAVGQ